FWGSVRKITSDEDGHRRTAHELIGRAAESAALVSAATVLTDHDESGIHITRDIGDLLRWTANQARRPDPVRVYRLAQLTERATSILLGRLQELLSGREHVTKKTGRLGQLDRVHQNELRARCEMARDPPRSRERRLVEVKANDDPAKSHPMAL